ncbi:MAG TPA: S-methyl-5-thioribose-1-phosphate isomerase [Pirellulales bacterium]|nr:S-methyl-5-thioribose-1-phosphate isomerase [Pirellulales bacterium]
MSSTIDSPASTSHDTPANIPSIQWIGDVDGSLRLLDQTLLPSEVVFLDCRDADTVFEAIRSLRVRGAPAIGIAAAYGLVLGVRDRNRQATVSTGQPAEDELRRCVAEAAAHLAQSRPTAVNLFWALDRMQRAGRATAANTADDLLAALLREARLIHEEDRAMCRAIGRFGAQLLRDGQGVLTHCNAGGLATAEYGTALAVFFAAQDEGKRLHVYADETRPLLQGARLTAWELKQRAIDVTLICDSMAAQVMREGRVQAVVVGADRIAANGDTANKIGTYGVAVLAAAHDIPFYVAAPTSTFDLSIANGDAIPIEQRAAAEVTHGFGRQTAPDGIQVYNPAFDVTPARLIRAIICERGVIEPVEPRSISALLGDRS